MEPASGGQSGRRHLPALHLSGDDLRLERGNPCSRPAYRGYTGPRHRVSRLLHRAWLDGHPDQSGAHGPGDRFRGLLYGVGARLPPHSLPR